MLKMVHVSSRWAAVFTVRLEHETAIRGPELAVDFEGLIGPPGCVLSDRPQQAAPYGAAAQ